MHFPLWAGTAGVGKGWGKVAHTSLKMLEPWPATDELSTASTVKKIDFAPFHFRLSWLQQLVWLAQAGYAKMQRCSFAFFCAFTFSARLAIQT